MTSLRKVPHYFFSFSLPLSHKVIESKNFPLQLHVRQSNVRIIIYCPEFFKIFALHVLLHVLETSVHIILSINICFSPFKHKWILNIFDIINKLLQVKSGGRSTRSMLSTAQCAIFSMKPFVEIFFLSFRFNMTIMKWM